MLTGWTGWADGGGGGTVAGLGRRTVVTNEEVAWDYWWLVPVRQTYCGWRLTVGVELHVNVRHRSRFGTDVYAIASVCALMLFLS